ncbi:MAG: ASKHA domain-containing protein [bacterium]|nr:ASKHA domain-containing protein [bacterium]
MYKGKKGLRCRICTGCGLCPGVTPENRAEGMHVLTEEGFGRERRFPQEGLASDDGAGKTEAVRATDAEVRKTEAAPVSGNDAGKTETVPVSGSGDRKTEAEPVSGNGAGKAKNVSRRLVTADIGTTTVAMLLYGTDGAVADRFVALNPQWEYGEDVISRIRAAEDRRKADEMRQKIRGVLEQGLERFRGRLREGENLFLAAAANTTMNYLLMGRDTSELGCAPFRASFLWEEETSVGDVPCFLMPGLSAFVGGDILAGMLACGMDESEELTLLVDLGTNGEIVLGNSRRRIACATAAGPAFEGGASRGVWGADMVSLLAALRREGLLDETGLLAEPFFEKGVRAGNVLVTRETVRGVQLAKAAVAAGIETLLKRYKASPDQVDRVILAGGFGYYLNPEDAALIGLLPAEWVKRTVAGGNTALSGALAAGRELLCGPAGKRRLTERLKRLAEGTECLNLAEEEDFGPRYIDRLSLKEMNALTYSRYSV